MFASAHGGSRPESSRNRQNRSTVRRADMGGGYNALAVLVILLAGTIGLVAYISLVR